MIISTPPMWKVLVVEDNVAHARFVRSVLEAIDVPVDVHQAGRLTSACERLQNETFDFIVTDMHLPDGQGASVVAELVELAGDIPVVVVSALDDPGMVQAAMSAGAHDYLVKDRLTPELLGHALVRAGQRATSQRSAAGGALIDAVSGAYNPRGLELAATKAVAFARRLKHPVTFVHVEVRASAEEATEVVRLAVGLVRDADFVGRIGMRRVILVLPNDRSDPPALLGRMASRLADSELSGVDLGIEVRRFDPDNPAGVVELLAVAPDPVEEAPMPGPRRRVLVVADDPALVTVVRSAIGTGWRVLEATSAGQAVRIAALEEPHLSIVDLDMDGGEGLAVVRKISEQAEVAGMSIIGIVGGPSGEQQSSSRARGMAAIVERRHLPTDLALEAERALR